MAKMTRKEAVELLKNRKVYVRNPKESEAVQKKLFECGFRWADGVSYIQHTNKPYLFIWDDMEIAQSSIEYVFNFSNQTEISAGEIKAIEIVDEKYVPKFGDIVRVDSPRMGTVRDYLICIMPDKKIPKRQTDDFFNIANINKRADLSFSCGYDIDLKLSLASESEKQELFDKLAKAGKRWNAERKCLEDIEQQELNLCEILKDCPKGTKFYSTIFGNVRFIGIRPEERYPILFDVCNKDISESVTQRGFYRDEFDGECTLFPSKDQRDWSKWVCPKSDLPIDTPVMVNDGLNSWVLRYYAQDKECWVNGYKSTDNQTCTQWNHIIPFDKFDPNNIEESLKYDICKK